MTPVKEMLLAVSSSLAASLVAKVTVITALALFAVWLARGRRAAVRHAFLAAAFGVTLLLPIASVLAPPFRLAVPMVVENRVSTARPQVRVGEIIPPVFATDVPDVQAIPMPKISAASLLLTVWIAGVAIFLLPLVIGLWQIRLLRRAGLPWPHGESLAETIARDAGIYRRVEVLLHEEVPGPMTCGIVHPTIVLPHDAENWSEEDLSRAFVHELEHVRRGDSVTSFLARGACAMYWFHPLVWIAWRRLALEAERSCDDAVLRRSDATAYAEQLVGLAKRLSVAQRSPLLAMASRADLSTRVRAVLDNRQRRGRAGVYSIGIACLAALGLIVTISPLRLVAAPQATPAAMPKFEVASIKLNKSGRAGWDGFKISHGSFNVANASLYMLITGAFHLQRPRVSGGPAWLTTDRFDISAKGDPNASDRQVLQMVQSLLIDRFGLVVHRETRDLPIYALVSAKNWPSKLRKPKDGACDTPAPESGSDAINSGKMDFMQAISCGGTAVVGGPQGGFLWGKSVPISSIADALSGLTDRPVVDRTGISGQFQYELRWSDGSPPVRNENEVTRQTAPDSEAPPSIFVAIQEQLGLKLEPATGPVEVLVIDHANKPSGN